MDWQGAGLKKIEANARVVVEVRNPVYFGNGELMERQVVVGEQRRGEICGRPRDKAPRKPRGSRSNSSTAIIRPQRSFAYLDCGFKPNVETVPVQARPPRCAPILFCLAGR